MKTYTGIGSRETPADVLKLMTQIAQTMAAKDFILRSGGADGADSAFEAGANGKAEIYLPWKGFNRRTSEFYPPKPEAFELAAKHHPAWNRCSHAARKLHARNGHQILGWDLKTPTDMVICWTKDGLRQGGTGQALRIAASLNIPIHDLALPEVRAAFSL